MRKSLIIAICAFLFGFLSFNVRAQVPEFEEPLYAEEIKEKWPDRSLRYRFFHEKDDPEHPRSVEYPKLALKSPEMFFVVHASLYWAGGRMVRPAIDDVLSYFTNRKLPAYYMRARSKETPYENSAQDFYPSKITSSKIINFEGDFHRIRIQARKIVVAGGYFTQCLCGFVTASLIQAPIQEPIEFVFLTDAIYENQPVMIPSSDPSVRLLSELLSQASRQRFMTVLKDLYFTPHRPKDENPDWPLTPCQTGLLTSLKYRFEVYLGPERIGTYGSSGPLVRMRFVASADYLRSQAEESVRR